METQEISQDDVFARSSAGLGLDATGHQVNVKIDNVTIHFNANGELEVKSAASQPSENDPKPKSEGKLSVEIKPVGDSSDLKFKLILRNTTSRPLSLAFTNTEGHFGGVEEVSKQKSALARVSPTLIDGSDIDPEFRGSAPADRKYVFVESLLPFSTAEFILADDASLQNVHQYQATNIVFLNYTHVEDVDAPMDSYLRGV